MSALPTAETRVSAHSPVHHFTLWFLEIPSRAFFSTSCFPLWDSDPPTLVLYQLPPPVTDFTCPHRAFKFFSCPALFVSMKFPEPWLFFLHPPPPGLFIFSSSLPRTPCFGRGVWLAAFPRRMLLNQIFLVYFTSSPRQPLLESQREKPPVAG